MRTLHWLIRRHRKFSVSKDCVVFCSAVRVWPSISRDLYLAIFNLVDLCLVDLSSSHHPADQSACGDADGKRGRNRQQRVPLEAL